MVTATLSTGVSLNNNETLQLNATRLSELTFWETEITFLGSLLREATQKMYGPNQKDVQQLAVNLQNFLFEELGSAKETLKNQRKQLQLQEELGLKSNEHLYDEKTLNSDLMTIRTSYQTLKNEIFRVVENTFSFEIW